MFVSWSNAENINVLDPEQTTLTSLNFFVSQERKKLKELVMCDIYDNSL